MANGVFHTAYGIEINLTMPDLDHPEYPGLLDEITTPIDRRDRELLECLQHHRDGRCEAEEQDEERSPWMTIRRRTVDGRTTWVAAHLPIRHGATPEESDKHKAMKERIARAADHYGLSSEIEAQATDGRVRTDVLVTGANGLRVGWEAQYSPITAETVRRRSRAAVDHGIVPLWVTSSERAALIDRAPWVRVDDLSWKEIASPLAMVVRAGVRHLQAWRCTPTSERACPVTGSSCGKFHTEWYLPALCIPPKPPTEVDNLVGASANGEFVPMRVPQQADPRSFSRMWVPTADRDRWREIVGPENEDEPATDQPSDTDITYTCQELDTTCRYGEETFAFNDPRPRRGNAAGTGLHTLDDVPKRLFVIPRQMQRLNISEQQRRTIAATIGCDMTEIGPCAGCGTPINRYGQFGAHACRSCRARVARR